MQSRLALSCLSLALLTGTAHDGSQRAISSIEVFEVVDGKITRVWNAEHTPGPWAQSDSTEGSSHD